MSNRRVKAEDVTINLTPMIDVVFLLVIFFMVGSKFSEAESRINVQVPSVGEMRSLSRTPDERVVEVTADGQDHAGRRGRFDRAACSDIAVPSSKLPWA